MAAAKASSLLIEEVADGVVDFSQTLLTGDEEADGNAAITAAMFGGGIVGYFCSTLPLLCFTGE